MTEYPHRMRLRPPWQSERTEHGVRLSRRFGKPTTLDEFERLWLTCDRFDGPATVSLNGDHIGSVADGSEGFAFHVTDRVLPRNEIAIDLTSESSVLGEVALEVRCPAWLSDLRTDFSDPPLLDGTVIGESASDLEIYAIADRSTVGYLSIAPFRDACQFELSLEIEGRPRSLRVELVHGAVVWDGRDILCESDT